MKPTTKLEPNCIICKKPVNIFFHEYVKEKGWKHKECSFSSMIPSVLSDSKEQSSLEKSNIRFVCLNEAICPIIPQRLADQKQELSKKFTELLMEKQDNILELNKQLADQKDKIRKWLSKNASLRDRNWMLKEFEELKL